ncbi:MAG: RsmB/NOP family class I SAM-dependent RNA methyltransferase [Halobacteriaceae archaeon]
MDDVLARYADLVPDYEAFRAACDTPLPTVVRVNPIKADPEEAVAALREAGVGVTRRDWHPGVLELDTDSPGTTWPYVHGWIHGQEEVSAIPPTVLDPDPGDAVLDACAAPGGKAAQLAGGMDDRGTLVANDDNLGRLAALRSNADRLGVTCAAVTNRDARDLDLDDFGFDAFDAALVDAPCSCEGTIRKNPSALDNWHEGYLETVSGTQKGILRKTVQNTRPGGRVAYATCTFAPEENEAVLDHVLARENCALVDFDVPLDSRPGVTEWQGETYDESVRNAKRFYPHLNDTGGFFVALLEVGR